MELPEGLGLGWPYLQCIYAHMTRQSLLADGVARRTRTRMAISAMYLCTHDQQSLLADGVARRTRTRMAISAMYLCTHDQAELAG